MMFSLVARGDVIWRVDFNGAAGDSYAASNFVGWTVSATSRTQTFANVDGGPITSNLTISLVGSGGTTYSTYERNMTSGAPTNFYRDGAQYNGTSAGAYLKVNLTGLAAGESYLVRLWYYDFSFSANNVETFTDITDGNSAILGSLTNVTGAAGAPSSLYDSRHMIEADLVAGASGNLNIRLTTDLSNQKLNGIEVIQSVVPEPASVTLLGLSLAALAWRRRCRKL